MERIPNGRYTREFHEKAVKMVAEGILSALEISRRLSFPKSTLDRWIRVSKKGDLGQTGKSHHPLTELEQELARVKRERSLTKIKPHHYDMVMCPGTSMRDCRGISTDYSTSPLLSTYNFMYVPYYVPSLKKLESP